MLMFPFTVARTTRANSSHQLDKVQRRAARFVKRDYRQTTSVSELLSVTIVVIGRTHEKCSSLPVLQGSTVYTPLIIIIIEKYGRRHRL